MARFRKPQQNIGRSEFQLRMPYPGASTPDGIQQNFRELERWGNALPLQRSDSFVPYLLTYTTPDPADSIDLTLSDLWQAKYATDLVPAGTWLVYVRVYPHFGAGPERIVGIRVIASTNGNSQSVPTYDYVYGGAYRIENAIRIVKDVDFVTPEVTYEWTLPYLTSEGIPYASQWAILTIDGDGGITFGGSCDATQLVDPDAGSTCTTSIQPVLGSVFAYRLTDYYNVPSMMEDVTPDP